ncbi:hypothetical protein [uncultured Ruminococcus sp.]|uniref:hypothetical protein n=1 Tax=uncultured Ruminococcus sp. TaxID=165186 RepID=UPI0025EC7F75|nr:hypothetical protein [uncultured Ruminococcus sp.]
MNPNDKRKIFTDEVSIGNDLHKYVQKFNAMAVETQDELIRKTVNSFAGGEFSLITIDKQKTIEALTDYLKKPEQLPRINKGHILKQAINTYGEDAQVDMAIEEMSELTKALLKQRRAVKKSDDVRILTTKCDIVEEIADVAIMLKQLLMMYDRNNEVQKQVDFKIDRLGERLYKHTEEK